MSKQPSFAPQGVVRPTAGTVASKLQQGMALLRQARLADAERVFSEVLQASPEHFDALRVLGIIALQTGRAQRGAALLQKAVGLQPQNAAARVELGNALRALGRSDEALACFDQAIALKPDLVDAYGARGRMLSELGRQEQALACYDKALELKPDLVQALNDRGNVLRTMQRYEEALATFDEVIRRQPEFALAHGNRGIVLRDMGRLDEALQSLDRAIALKPDFAFAFNNRGLALSSLQRHEEALQSFDRAIALQPNFAAAHHNRGMALRELRRYPEALASYEAAIEHNRRFAAAHASRGTLLCDLCRYEDAVTSFDTAITLAPDRWELYNNRGLALKALRRFEEALASFDRALALQPQFAPAHSNRGDVFFELRRFEHALASYDQALACQPDSALALNNRGNALRELNRFEEALASYERAVALKPDFPQALGNKGQLLMELGRFEQARDAIALAIESHPREARLYYIHSQCGKMSRDDLGFAALEELSRHADSLDAPARIYLEYALSKAYGDIGERDRAFQAMQQGAAFKRKTLDYDEASALAALQRTAATVSAPWLRANEGKGHPSMLPVFVFGMARSGTTLVEQILASHPQVFGAGEIGDFSDALSELSAAEIPGVPFPEFVLSLPEGFLRRLGAAYVERVRRLAPDAGRITNKEVGNFRYAGLIHLALPEARLIHVRRDPMDTCFSCYAQLFVGTRLPYTYDFGELARYYRAYEKLMEHWREALPPGAMLEVQYEELVADLEGQSRRIVQYCGLDWDPRCLDFHETERMVRTASLTQVRQPVYKKSIGRWRAYEAHLRPLQEELERSG